MINKLDAIAWLRKNLFSSWYNAILTIISLSLLYWIGTGFAHWAITEAEWGVVEANFRLFFVGDYGRRQLALLWRPWLTLGIIMSMGGLSWGLLSPATANLFSRKNLVFVGLMAIVFTLVSIPSNITASVILWGFLLLMIANAIAGKKLSNKIPQLISWLPLLWIAIFFINLWILLGTKYVKLDDLSGLILNILIAVVSISLCFPLGVILALGRQSKLPVIRWLSIAYIEIIRALPLIGILFMAQVMLPLILPVNMRPDRVIRVIAGFTIFSSAYLAENVRGGLQAVPQGQVEAAKALGLNSFYTIGFIVLPQAIRAVIPSIVGQFISLFKDTSLLAIVGLVDLLGISEKIVKGNPKFLGDYQEVYVFIALIFWLICYAMSLVSRRLETKT
ncbi:amine acid ABC transporter, permease protein, 3-TM region, His/Glu/Gln/Arg/opine family [Xenococcus sp. PCC 7305]|uniref:amino acid ABC transporter permease n=1 Tax=Xenococcus sp. PCC 7305 TaxID=102125 RepID=UPI0002AC4104|nr:amino acid ABC transporter permease [Xenococcus sp. PCC 7305]ELS00373.1 amine acid ABC transporter, permease protein, 3-TM region, His/Glu/Gln/Arg/opine family [Xenococcus sp. PCC 7305]